MIAFRLAAVALLVALSAARHPSDPVKICGSAIGRLFEHPACDTKGCADNWPRGRLINKLAYELCMGEKTVETVMGLCCIPDADMMGAIVDEVLGHDAPAHAVRSYVPRVPNVPRPKVQQNFDDLSIFNF